MLQTAAFHLGADASLRRERGARLLVRHQFAGADQPHAAGLSHQRVVVEARQPFLEVAPYAGRVAVDVALLHQFQGAQRHRRAHRMAGVGVAVPEHAPAFARLDQHVDHRVRRKHRADRQVGGGQGLGQAHRRRLHAHCLGAEACAQPPEAADHLVVDQRHVVLVQDRLDALVVARGRHHDAARAHDRLGDEGRHGLGAFGADQVVQFAGQPFDELVFRLAGFRLAVVMRAGDVEDPRQREIETLVEGRQAGKAARAERRAVVGPPAADDLLLLGSAQGVVVVPGELDLRLVRVGARDAEERLGVGDRGHLPQLLRQRHRRFVALAGEEVRVGEVPHLLRRNLGQLFHAVAQGGAPEAGQALDVLPALLVPDPDALRPGDDERTVAAMIRQVGRRVEDRLDVPGGDAGGGWRCGGCGQAHVDSGFGCRRRARLRALRLVHGRQSTDDGRGR